MSGYINNTIHDKLYITLHYIYTILYTTLYTTLIASMVSYFGHALDEKTPLLRASDALSREGTKLLHLLGYKSVKGIQANIGLEQEFFFVPRDAYLKRPDLQLSGRTIMGKQPPRSQEVRLFVCIYILFIYSD